MAYHDAQIFDDNLPHSTYSHPRGCNSKENVQIILYISEYFILTCIDLPCKAYITALLLKEDISQIFYIQKVTQNTLILNLLCSF